VGRYKEIQWLKKAGYAPFFAAKDRNNYLINIDNRNKKSRMGTTHPAYLKMLKTLFLSL
jgi:hypothetical protein